VADKKRPGKRNRLDFVHSGTKPGDVVSVQLLPPGYVTELRDNKDDFGNPLQVGRILPGVRATLTLSGCPFAFTVRVVPDEDGTPQLVDLRVRSPIECGDVAITNADVKAISVATLTAAALNPPFPGVEVTADETEPGARVARRTGRPTQLTDEFLRDVTLFAREAWREGHPINGYVAARMLAADKIRYQANDETVRGWRKAAVRRRRQSEGDDSFLISGELRGRPPKPGRPNNTETTEDDDQ
jgi:hypothetical protein